MRKLNNKIFEILQYLNLKLAKSDEISFLITVNLIFPVILLYGNFSNKMMIILFVGFFLMILYRFRDLGLSVFLTYISATTLYVGKTYQFLLLDLRGYPYDVNEFPSGAISAISTIRFSDIFIFILAVYVLRKIIYREYNFMTLNKLDFLVFLFVVYRVIASSIISEDPFLSFILQKEFMGAAISYLYIRLCGINTNKIFKYILASFSGIIIFQGFLAIMQYLRQSSLGKSIEVVQGILIQYGEATDEQGYQFRPLGTFYHANYLAIYIGSLLPIIFYTALKSRKKEYFLTLMAGLIIVIVTQSRVIWFSLSIAMLIYLFFIEHKHKINLFKIFPRRYMILFMTVITAFVLFFTPARIAYTVYTGSGGLSYRILQMQESLNLLESNPFGVGEGFHVPALIKNKPDGIFAHFPYNPHNYLLNLALKSGFPSIIIFTVLVVYSMLRLWKSANSYSLALFASLVTLLICGLLQPRFDERIFMILLALSANKYVSV